MARLDPYKHKEKFDKWKVNTAAAIPNISSQNSELIKKYIADMEIGINVSTKNGCKKGGRSYTRLTHIIEKMMYFSKKFKEIYNLDYIPSISEDQVFELFAKMRNGDIKKQNGECYTDVYNYVKDFKAFWHWWMKLNKKKGNEIKDITEDLDTRKDKPKWVYFTEEQIKILWQNAKFFYKVLIMFLYESGVRAPSELINIKVMDIEDKFSYLQLTVWEDIHTKTKGRVIKLFFCRDILLQYIESEKLKPEDYLFTLSPPVANKYLKRLSTKLFGDEITKAGQKYSQLSMYDFRHNSACYWIKRYSKEINMIYRFGWKNADKAHYYSEFLGLRDTIEEEELLVGDYKTENEKRLLNTERENEKLKDDMAIMKEQIKQVEELTKSLYEKYYQNSV